MVCALALGLVRPTQHTTGQAGRMLDAQRQELALQHGAKLAELKFQRQQLEEQRAKMEAQKAADLVREREVRRRMEQPDGEIDALDGVVTTVDSRRSPKVAARTDVSAPLFRVVGVFKWL